MASLEWSFNEKSKACESIRNYVFFFAGCGFHQDSARNVCRKFSIRVGNQFFSIVGVLDRNGRSIQLDLFWEESKTNYLGNGCGRILRFSSVRDFHDEPGFPVLSCPHVELA